MGYKRNARLFGRGLAASSILGAGLIGGWSLSASAAPSNAPKSTAGIFSCVNGESGTFVVNGGDGNGQGTSFSSAHLTFDSGGTGVFHPVAFDLTFTSPQGTFTNTAQKNNTSKGSVTCDISANPAPGFNLSGTVTGTITTTG